MTLESRVVAVAQHNAFEPASLSEASRNPPSPDADKRDWAAFLASLGLPVFKLTDGVVPAYKQFWEGATTDSVTAYGMWTRSDGEPENWNNVGIATGDGIVGLDFDFKNDKQGELSLFWMEQLNDLPQGIEQRTKSGGIHRIFAVPPGTKIDSSQSQIAAGVDVRGHHGYLVGAGSVVDGKRYKYLAGELEPLPASLVKVCQQKRRTRPDVDPASMLVKELDTPDQIEKAIDYLVNYAPESIQGDGGDGTTYQVCVTVVKDYAISEEMALQLIGEHYNEAGKADPPWKGEELQEKIAHAARYGQNPIGAGMAKAEFEPVDIDDDEGNPNPGYKRPQPPVTTSKRRPSPAKLKEDGVGIPPRDFIYGKHYIRGFTSCTIAPGGVGKSLITMTEAVAMATGKNLIGATTGDGERKRVWLWNEDPLDELDRRLAGICKDHDIQQSEVEGWLFMDSARDFPLNFATASREGLTIHTETIDEIASLIKECCIDVFIIDPYADCHLADENDNNQATQLVRKGFDVLAHRANCAIEIVHHSRKTRDTHNITVDDSRGASSLVYLARAARSFSTMSETKGKEYGIDKPWTYVRADDGKANMAPMDKAKWVRIVQVPLSNGDIVAAPEVWVVPEASVLPDLTPEIVTAIQDKVDCGEWRKDKQAGDWVGYAVGAVLGFSKEVGGEDKKKLGRIADVLISQGHLEVQNRKDKNHKNRPFVVVGERV